MIWYLLYPFRGTTEPPHLSSNHPIRKTFYRYGAGAARHWLQWILFSVAIAVLLCYPVFFLYDNPTAGFRKLPHHVWTSAKAYEGRPDVKADVEVRQVWVHGSYMRALEKELLLEALDVQEHLVGAPYGNDMESGQGVFDGATEFDNPLSLSWGIHSPLMFWNCSSAAIRSDDDILATINSQSQCQTYLNFTLRPTSVFAGKLFVKDRLAAADALVVTFFDRSGSATEQQWEERMKALVNESAGRLTFYPSDGNVTGSQLYEFTFQPLSFNDDFMLAVAYLLTAVYLTISLGNQKAVKSRFGLVLAIVTEIGVSIVASFTICGLLKIDLARIPREVYPFVVVILGLENMSVLNLVVNLYLDYVHPNVFRFRLINAVFALPPQTSAIVRVANALGDVGHLSLAAAFQNLCVLWLLSKVVSPGVSAFCAYAAVALIFDFMFHLTFLVAVLSVDIRRIELQDSLDKVTIGNTPPKQGAHERKYWLVELFAGKLPFSTRIAGSAVTICFVLALNGHFDYPARPASILKLVRWVFSSRNTSHPLAHPTPAPINQARTPAAWLRMQDYATAREVVGFVKPGGYSFLARVYDPLFVVLAGANRYAEVEQNHSILTTIQEAVSEHVFHFTISLVFAIAVITLLMNYLLFKELPEDDLELVEIEDRLFTFNSLPIIHSLDVTKLVSSRKGHFVSISLDRLVTIHIYDVKSGEYSQHAIATMAVVPPLWPIVACSIDDTGTWIAMCAESGSIAIWSIPRRGISWICRLDLPHFPLCTFQFATISHDDVGAIILLTVTPSGWLVEIDPVQSSIRPSHRVYDGRIISSTLISRPSQHPRLLITTQKGETLVACRDANGSWGSSPLTTAINPDYRPRATVSISALGLCAVLAADKVIVCDSSTLSEIEILHFGKIKMSSFRFLHSQRRSCHSCGGTAVHSICIAYADAVEDRCRFHTFTAKGGESALICLRDATNPSQKSCKGLGDATEAVHTIPCPGAWEATSDKSLVGLRRKPMTNGDKIGSASTTSAMQSDKIPLPHSASAPKYRLRSNNRAVLPNSSRILSAPWEVWTISSSGEFQTSPLNQEEGKSRTKPVSDGLFVSRPGPMARLGKWSVGVGFANQVKIISLGPEKSIVEEDDYVDASATVKWRRRNPSKKTA
ncbi:hypothetical protein P152DRAFT_4269 [Eremomyces bilateralis CBS 781.70]|uniref:SSD domain-containing protein n=1 Tax=Eremomyces bilateralis CBS 781.70 TaxID=1392243 RepID=A0A6G1GFT8_9PEZI|nr:uncharacterized protein P152DRAFT_4269 [Eremomyces bilateralis CBS 781.70]KAF1816938.1 hypothetical protein P152DRAFT_4269 [Eremomyces bilateralis CBS 781.70]